eukprot:scaffold8807_cov110-Isochrysis_galbana.AAC.3
MPPWPPPPPHANGTGVDSRATAPYPATVAPRGTRIATAAQHPSRYHRPAARSPRRYLPPATRPPARYRGTCWR